MSSPVDAAGKISVVIVGAGPSGMATAACLASRKIDARLLDREASFGGAYRTIYDGITLASPTALTALPGLPRSESGEYTRVPEYRDYLARYAVHFRLAVEPTEVRSIARDGDRGFLVTRADGDPIRARAVVIATGMWGSPIRPAFAAATSEAAPLTIVHSREWRGPAVHREARILVVGAATSGVEIAEEIAGAGRSVTISARGGKVKIAAQRLLGIDLHYWVKPLERLPLALARGYCGRRPTLPGTDLGFGRFRKAGLVTVKPEVARIEGATVHFVDGSRGEFDLVVTATGYRFETPFLPPEVARAPAGHLLAKGGESVTWPGLFVVGFPCGVGLGSEFLRGIASDAEAVAGRIARLA